MRKMERSLKGWIEKERLIDGWMTGFSQCWQYAWPVLREFR